MFQDIRLKQTSMDTGISTAPLATYGITSVVYLTLAFELTQPQVPKRTCTLDPFPYKPLTPSDWEAHLSFSESPRHALR